MAIIEIREFEKGEIRDRMVFKNPVAQQRFIDMVKTRTALFVTVI